MTTEQERLRFALATWRSKATHKDIVDAWVTQMLYELVDSKVGIMAQELTISIPGLSYVDAVEVLAKSGMLDGWEEETCS